MKKANKVMLLIGGGCIGVGVVMLIAGMILGAGTTVFRDVFRSPQERFHGIFHVFDDDHYEDAPVTESAESFLEEPPYYSDSEEPPLHEHAPDYGETEHYEVTEHFEEAEHPGEAEHSETSLVNEDGWIYQRVSDIQDMKLEVTAGELQISEYDGEGLEISYFEEDAGAQIEKEEEELEISLTNPGSQVFLQVPYGYQFHEVEIEVMTGTASIDVLTANQFDAEVHVGELYINEILQAEKSSWKLDSGVTEVQLLVSDSISIENTAGNLFLYLAEDPDIYYLEGQVNGGSLIYDDQVWEYQQAYVRFGDKERPKKIDVECAAGEVQIAFQ